MPARELNDPLAELRESELVRLARTADPLLAGRPLLSPGHRPTRGRPGQGFEFLDHQDYAIGDDQRAIDWRASARTRHPQIRRFRDEHSADWFICLDRSASMGTDEEITWRLGIQLAAAMAYLLLHLGNRVGLMLFSRQVDRQIPLGRGRGQYARVAATLRRCKPEPAGGASSLTGCTQRLVSGAPAVIISDFLRDDDFEPDLGRLLAGAHTLHVFHLNHAAQFASLPAGPQLLSDAESGEAMTLDINPATVAKAEQLLEQRKTSLARYCRRTGIRYTDAPTSKDWKAVLARHLAGYERSNALAG